MTTRPSAGGSKLSYAFDELRKEAKELAERLANRPMRLDNAVDHMLAESISNRADRIAAGIQQTIDEGRVPQ